MTDQPKRSRWKRRALIAASLVVGALLSLLIVALTQWARGEFSKS